MNIISRETVNYLRGVAVGASTCLVQDVVAGRVQSVGDLAVNILQKVVLLTSANAFFKLPVINELSGSYLNECSELKGIASSIALSVAQNVLLGNVRSIEDLVADIAIKCLLITVCKNPLKIIMPALCFSVKMMPAVCFLAKTIGSGFATGLFFGSCVNFINNQSLFSSSHFDCVNFINEFPLMGLVNHMREGNALLLTPLLAPIFAFGFSNAGNLNHPNVQAPHIDRSPEDLGRAIVGLKPFVIPTLASFSAICGSIWLRNEFTSHFPSIDTSGHVLIAIGYSHFCRLLLNEVENSLSPGQILFVKNALWFRNITDIAWAYNTAAYCHSIADVVSATAIGVLSTTLVQSVVAVVKKVCNRIQANRLAPNAG